MRLELADVRYRYAGARDEALRGVSLTVGAGECVALLGRSGAGKSTLLQVAAGLLRPSTGAVRVDEGEQGCAFGVGLVPQHPERHLFRDTVAEEVGFGVRRLGGADTDARVDAALSAVGLAPEQFRWRHPRHLSGGEQRRVALACTLALEPRVLLLDEPLASLDGAGQRRVAEIVAGVKAEGRGVLLSTQVVEPLLAVVDRVALLAEGEVVGEGLPSRMLADGELLRRAGVAMPSILRLVEALRARGMEGVAGVSPGAVVESLVGSRTARPVVAVRKAAWGD